MLDFYADGVGVGFAEQGELGIVFGEGEFFSGFGDELKCFGIWNGSWGNWELEAEFFKAGEAAF